MSKNLLAGCDDFVNNGGHTYHSVFLVAYVNGVVTATKYNQDSVVNIVNKQCVIALHLNDGRLIRDFAIEATDYAIVNAVEVIKEIK